MLKLKGQDDTQNVTQKQVSFDEDCYRDDLSTVQEVDSLVDDFSQLSTERKNLNVDIKPTVSRASAETEKKKDNPLLSVAVLLGFAAWIGALVYFSKTEPRLCISTFGAFWLLIAIVSVVGFIKDGIKDLRNVIVAFVFVYLGIALTFVPILQLYVPKFQGQFGFRMAMYLVFIFCIVLGALLIGVEIYNIIHGRAVCTVQVQAECLKLRDKHFWRDEVSVEEAKGYWYGGMRAGSVKIGWRGKPVSGVYQFEYRGQTYEVQDNINSAFDHPTPGKMLSLFINPKNPNEFYRPMPLTHMGLFIIGFSFFAVGILCCVLF